MALVYQSIKIPLLMFEQLLPSLQFKECSTSMVNKKKTISVRNMSSGKKAVKRKGPSKCQVVCASVKNARRASSLLNAALALGLSYVS